MKQQPAVAFPPPLFVDLSGFRMAYHAWGPSGAARTVVLLHSITGASIAWNEVGPALVRRHRVFALDMKGRGDSGRPPSGYRISDQAEEVAEFCTALGLRHPAVVGHSWGGAIALQLATSTDLVDRLVLEDPWLGDRTPDPKGWAEFEELVATSAGLSREEAERRAAEYRAQGWSELGVAGVIEAMTKCSPAAVHAVFAENGPFSLHDLLPALRCPTLLLYAAPELGGMVDAEALALARANPHVRAELVAGASHLIHRTRLEAFMAAVEPFLAGDGI